MSDKFEFPNCMHALSAGMHMLRIDPHEVTISLPRDKWWSLHCEIERRFRGFMRFDGRALAPEEFRYMGFRFIPC